MAASRPDQAKTGAAGASAMIGTPRRRTPRPCPREHAHRPDRVRRDRIPRSGRAVPRHDRGGAVRTHMTAAAGRTAYAADPAGSPRSSAVMVAGLRKSYGAVQAVRGTSFTVSRGEIFALLGPNGAGKTTTLEILEGFRTRDAGQVEVLGLDPGDRSHGRALRERIGLVLQDIAVEPYLTVRETIARNAGYYPAPRDVDEVIALVGLAGQTAAEGPGPFRWPEAAPGPGAGPDRRPGTAVPRRADHRVRPERAPGRLADRPQPARPGNHDPAHHPLHGRGPGAGRPGGGDLRRPDRRGRDASHHRRP